VLDLCMPPHNFFLCFLCIITLAYISRNLREMFKLDAAEYMMSICGDSGLRDISSPGKSGSIFFLSQDDRFVIKTLKKYELKVCNHPFFFLHGSRTFSH